MKPKFLIGKAGQPYEIPPGLTERCFELLQTVAKHPGHLHRHWRPYLQTLGYSGPKSSYRPVLDRLFERGLACEIERDRSRVRVVIITVKGRLWLQKAEEVLTAIS